MAQREDQIVDVVAEEKGSAKNSIEFYDIIAEDSDLIDPEEILESDPYNLTDKDFCEIEENGLLDELAKIEAKSGSGLLSDEEERALLEQIKKRGKAAGDAIAEIYLRNQGLVKSVVGRYRKRSSWLSYDDLVVEGNIGLLTAISKYESSKNVRFSTYAYGVIRGRVLKAQKKDPRVVKPDVKLTEELIDLNNKFYEVYHREPEAEIELIDFAKELTDESGKPIWDTDRLKRATLKYRQSLSANSLDAPLDGGEEGDDDGDDALTPGDFQVGTFEQSAIDKEADSKRAKEIKEAIDEARLDSKTTVLLTRFLEDPSGVFDDSEVAVHLGNPTKSEISRLLRDGLKNKRLRKALIKRGLIKEGSSS